MSRRRKIEQPAVRQIGTHNSLATSSSIVFYLTLIARDSREATFDTLMLLRLPAFRRTESFL